MEHQELYEYKLRLPGDTPKDAWEAKLYESIFAKDPQAHLDVFEFGQYAVWHSHHPPGSEAYRSIVEELDAQGIECQGISEKRSVLGQRKSGPDILNRKLLIPLTAGIISCLYFIPVKHHEGNHQTVSKHIDQDSLVEKIALALKRAGEPWE